MNCPSCQAPVAGLVCEACGAIPPPRPIDRFAALGAPRRYHLEATDLEARYRELSRRLHPDRFAKAPARERMLSLQAATALNDAYRTVRSPVARAEYLCELEGVKVDDKAALDPDFLMEIMELREELQAARTREDREALARLGADMRARRERALAAVDAGFAAYERDGAREHLTPVRDRLVELRYVQRFLDELLTGEEAA